MLEHIIIQTVAISLGFIATFFLALNQTVERKNKKVVYGLAILIAIAFVLNVVSLAFP